MARWWRPGPGPVVRSNFKQAGFTGSGEEAAGCWWLVSGACFRSAGSEHLSYLGSCCLGKGARFFRLAAAAGCCWLQKRQSIHSEPPETEALCKSELGPGPGVVHFSREPRQGRGTRAGCPHRTLVVILSWAFVVCCCLHETLIPASNPPAMLHNSCSWFNVSESRQSLKLVRVDVLQHTTVTT